MVSTKLNYSSVVYTQRATNEIPKLHEGRVIWCDGHVVASSSKPGSYSEYPSTPLTLSVAVAARARPYPSMSVA